MFERFTDRARRVAVRAEDEAAMLGHHKIDTGHMLVGLVDVQEGVGAKALESMGISLESVRAQVGEIIGLGEQPPPSYRARLPIPEGIPFQLFMPLTPGAKKVIEHTLRAGLELRHNYIGTEHILLGLAREGDGVAARVLMKFGVDVNSIREHVIRQQSVRGDEQGE